MKFGLCCVWKRRSCTDLIKTRRFHKTIFALIFGCFFLGTYWVSGPGTSHASSDNTIPEPKEDKGFGPSCPPGFCRISNGYMMGLRDMALGVAFIDDKKGWIVGNFGLGLKTEDGGLGWEKKSFSEEAFLKDVYFAGQKGWVVGERGVILHTDDGGDNWKEQTSNGESLLSVFFIDENKGFTAGSDGTILGTEDAGATWKSVDLGWDNLIPEELLELGVISINLYDIFFITDTLGWIVGDAGTVLRTTDGGKQWSVTNMDAVPPLFSVCFKNEQEGVAVGSHGFCLKTNDGGLNWEKFKIGTENSLFSVVFYKDYGVAVGDLATVIKTLDGGKTWVKVPNNIPPPYPWFADVCILSSGPVKALSVGRSIIFNSEITSER